MKQVLSALLALTSFTLTGCTLLRSNAPDLPHWTFDPAMIFPADQSLLRAEDGVILADGRLIVADQAHGLRLVNPDGSSRPFGNFAAAGYAHNPPAIVGAPNGVSLEPSGSHILVADIYRGGIYRVDVATEATERILQHPFGVNTAVRDSLGGLWFTQSTQNPPEHGEEELIGAVVVPRPDGALFYLAPPGGDTAPAPAKLDDNLNFGNGIVLDEAAGFLYLAETTGNRVLRYNVDVAAGSVSGRSVLLEVNHPDNLELDAHNRLWIASPIAGKITVFDLASQTAATALHVSTPESEALVEAIDARVLAGESWIDLFTPVMWEPAPGAITGIILTPDGEPAYFTGLGNAILRLQP